MVLTGKLEQQDHKAQQGHKDYKGLKANQDQLEPMVKTAQLVIQDPLAHKAQQDRKGPKVSQVQMV